jgi:hypothetical protein
MIRAYIIEQHRELYPITDEFLLLMTPAEMDFIALEGIPPMLLEFINQLKAKEN